MGVARSQPVIARTRKLSPTSAARNGQAAAPARSTGAGTPRVLRLGRTATAMSVLSAELSRALKRERAPQRPLSIQLYDRYGQAPVTMSAPGPGFFQVSAPTVDSMQYVVPVADWMKMFLTPASYVVCRYASVAPAYVLLSAK